MKSINNICFIHISARPGGIEVLLPLIIKSSPAYKFSAFVIRPFPVEDSDIYHDVDIPIVKGSFKNYKALYKIITYARKNKKSIFHAYNIGPLFLLALRLGGIQNIVYSIHGTVYWKKKSQKMLLKFLWWLSLGKNIKITANTDFSKKVFEKKITDKYSIETLYNPIDTKKFTAANKPHLDLNKLKILYCGRFAPGKNLLAWVKIAAGIRSVFPGTQFFMYGQGPLKDEVEKHIFEKGYENFIYVRGFRNDIENAYKESDVLLFLSEYESFGNVAVESILTGTPAIVSNIPSMQEIFKSYPGFMVSLEDNLQKQIISKLRELDKLLAWTKSAQKEFRSRFSSDSHISQLHRIYQSFSA